MKKLLVFAAFTAGIALASCGGGNANKPVDDSQPKKEDRADSLVGDWIAVSDGSQGEITDTTGITLKKGGVAQSINMPTYQYSKWKLVSNDTIVLNAKSTAEGIPADTSIVDTGIVDMKANTISLFGGDIVYKKK